MHIGLYSDSFPPLVDGVCRTVENYARILNQTGYESYVVAPYIKGYQDKTDYTVIRYPTVPMKMKISDEYRLAMPAAARHVQRRLEHTQTDIVHAHSPFFCGQAAKTIANKLDVPLIATFHSKFKDDVKVRLNMDLPAQMVAKYVAYYFNRCDYVWAVNRGTANTLREYGYEGEITVMPNGSDIMPSYAEPGTKERICSAYHLDHTVPLLLFVGRMTRTKNTLLLIDSLAAVARASGAFNMLFVGDGEDIDIMKRKVYKQGLGSRTVFAGKVMDRAFLKEIYQSADLFAFPSVYDNAPLVVREAAACGCPSLMIEGSNSAEDTVDGKDAFLCKETREDLAVKIYAAITHPEKLKQVGEEARTSMFMSWDDAVRLAEKEYDRILGEWVPQKRHVWYSRAY